MMHSEEVLGAGSCSADTPCNPDQVSSFTNSRKNVISGRLQNIYISYEEPAFQCIDRSQTESKFNDTSWHPWATYKELTEGVELKAERFGDQNVFWKFISDIAYLQAPIHGSVHVSGAGSCVPCQGHDDPEGCADPIEVGPDHSMWAEKGDAYSNNCSMRHQWTTSYLARPRLTMYDLA